MSSFLPNDILKEILQNHAGVMIHENKFASFLDRLETNLNKNPTSSNYSLFGDTAIKENNNNNTKN